jgi:hypothetical protein
MNRRAACLAAALGALLLAGCGGSRDTTRVRTPAVPASPPAPDSAAIALWHLDEAGGTRAADAGPFRLDAVAGIDTRTDFGRFHSARVFRLATDSFVYAPYNPVMNVTGAFTVEAWINQPAMQQDFQVIAARWTPTPNEQSWVFGVSGRLQTTGWLSTLVAGVAGQRLVFGYMPAGAGGERSYPSNNPLPLDRWVHVAASVDGEIVRIYVDGRLDAQYVNTRTVRPSPAPLLVGNAIDTRHLTTFGGDLRVDMDATPTVAYPFVGSLDEVRLSRGARARFEGFPSR